MSKRLYHAQDMSPAKWIWLPVARTLPNTFVLFRKDFTLDAVPETAEGGITVDGRYQLYVNGKRVQWGPAPYDPRYMEVDPVNIKSYLRRGKNVIAVEVVWFGLGEGTYVPSKPGFLFKLKLNHGNGSESEIVSDNSWLCQIDQGRRPGHFSQWFLRALQEEFDARHHPYGWKDIESSQQQWMMPKELKLDANLPTIASEELNCYENFEVTDPHSLYLRRRIIPMLREKWITVCTCVDAGIIRWRHTPNDWFYYRMDDAFDIRDGKFPFVDSPYALPRNEVNKGVFLTFKLDRQRVGWVEITIDAPEGTVVELIFQESADLAKARWLETHHHSWVRFTCREGKNTFRSFEYFCFAWVQVHVWNNNGTAKIHGIKLLDRRHPFRVEPIVVLSDPELDKVAQAAFNTIYNAAQETCADGMGRERQQYSGDCAHQMAVLRCACHDRMLNERYLLTYGDGLTCDGYFLDCWPGIDRLKRIAQRHLNATPWGPILDHGVQYVFDCWSYVWETGETTLVESLLPKLLRFGYYLDSIRKPDGLLPVESDSLGVPIVWIDRDGYRDQRDKQCVFNLYVSAMLTHALAKICRFYDKQDDGDHFEALGRGLLESAVDCFWDADTRLFIVNKPWLNEGDGPRYCDRSLANALLYGQCPETDQCLTMLASDYQAKHRKSGWLKNMGIAYPANAIWRHRALAKHGRLSVVLSEFRRLWAHSDSVRFNQTLSETMYPEAGGTDEWSHCSATALYILYQAVTGIEPLEPGCGTVLLRPQVDGLDDIQLTFWTPLGAIRFSWDGEEIVYELPVSVAYRLETDLCSHKVRLNHVMP